MLAYFQLVRLPNVFTAIADVLLGYVVTHGALDNRSLVATLVGASVGLYWAGMIFNDVFDRDLDAVERPDRPIPSGGVPLRMAQFLGAELLLVGVGLGFLASFFTGDPRSAGLAVVLALTVMLYNAVVKKTVLGPVAMGACRMMNVLLGMSASPEPWEPWHFLIAGGLGVYIVGVTLFAKTEATTSRRPQLIVAVAIMLAGLATAAYYPWQAGGLLRLQTPDLWLPAWGLLAVSIGWRCALAIRDPKPELVQRAVKHCLLSLIVLDAVLTLPIQNQLASLLIVALIFPANWLGRWLYST